METNSKGKIKHKIPGLLLCAGLSGRMGTSKAMMVHNGLPFAVSIIKKLLLVCKDVIIVVGHESAKVEAGIKNYLKEAEISRVKFILNANYKDGMFSSIQCGLKYVSNTNWILYHFVDQPLIPDLFYLEFVHQLSGDINWIQPRYSGKPGHPILFNDDVSSFISAMDKDSSLRNLKNDKRITRQIWNCKYPEVLQDIDTIEEFNRLNCDS
jgi:molybdenum cofactor cytidylyltransferase